MDSHFNDAAVMKYLDLPADYDPRPSTLPISFLHQHLPQLPPHLACQFSSITTPKQRTTLALIRNRRLKYTKTAPNQLSFSFAKQRWPILWQGRGLIGREQGEEERRWGESSFMEGQQQQIQKLGTLLGAYEEEREAERIRVVRRAKAEEEFIPEEDEDSCSDSEPDSSLPDNDETPEEVQAAFERLIKERFIYGLLDGADYNVSDWNEEFDDDEDREAEEKWFDEEDE